MSRTIYGNLTGRAASTHRSDLLESQWDEIIKLTPRENLEIDLSVSEKMYRSLLKNGFKKEAQRYRHRAYRIRKKLYPPNTSGMSPLEASEALNAFLKKNWKYIPEIPL